MEIYGNGSLYISTDPEKMDSGFIHHFLSKKSYWAEDIPLETVIRSLKGSLCFGVFDGGSQIGFARIISDLATFAYLADVFIDENYRKRGLSKWLMEIIIAHPSLQGLRAWMLATSDAQGLYQQFGFKPLAHPERIMRRHDPEVYKKNQHTDDRLPAV